MFSDETVKELAEEFVCVKVDPRETRDAWAYKATRYVPEVVFIDSELDVVTRLDMNDRSVAGFTSLMRRVLAHVREL